MRAQKSPYACVILMSSVWCILAFGRLHTSWCAKTKLILEEFSTTEKKQSNLDHLPKVLVICDWTEMKWTEMKWIVNFQIGWTWTVNFYWTKLNFLNWTAWLYVRTGTVNWCRIELWIVGRKARKSNIIVWRTREMKDSKDSKASPVGRNI